MKKGPLETMLASSAFANTTAVTPLRFLPIDPGGRRRSPAAHKRRLSSLTGLELDGNLNTLGYFSAEVCVGNPAKSFDLIIDTGSALTAFPVRASHPIVLIACDVRSHPHGPHPHYAPTLLLGNIVLCSQIISGTAYCLCVHTVRRLPALRKAPALEHAGLALRRAQVVDRLVGGLLQPASGHALPLVRRWLMRL